MGGRAFTPMESNRIKRLYRRGLSMRRIARIVGCTYGAVWHLAVREGFHEPRPRAQQGELIKFVFESVSKTRWLSCTEIAYRVSNEWGKVDRSQVHHKLSRLVKTGRIDMREDDDKRRYRHIQ